MRPWKQAYVGDRADLASLIPPECHRILDLGCAAGDLGATIKRRRRAAKVFGLERDPEMAREASTKLDGVVVGDLDDPGALRSFEGQDRFDCLVFGDVLEHLVDPWTLLARSLSLLEPSGHVVASIPNVGHLDTIANLLVRQRWPYRDRGVHDRTHLRQFALRNVEALFSRSGLEVTRLERTYRIVERPHPANRWARFLAVPFLSREVLTYQFLVVARRHDGS